MSLLLDIVVHDVQPYTSSHFNMTHKIRHLSFGLNIPGKTNPMDDTTVVAMEGMFLLLNAIFIKDLITCAYNYKLLQRKTIG